MFDGPRTVSRNGKDATMFSYLSKDGEEGFPGAVECRVWYATSEERGTVILDVEYEVEMVGKESEEEGIYETVVAVTNHRLVIIPYFMAFKDVEHTHHNFRMGSRAI